MSRTNKRQWGGARPGAGRPKETLSAASLREMKDKEREWAKKNNGKDVNDFIMAVIYNDTETLDLDSDVSLKDRIACAKLWKDKTMIPVSEGGEADQGLAPVTYLPEERPVDNVVKGEFN